MAVLRMHFVDWIIFAFGIVVSAGIGIYHTFTGGKHKTTDDYLRGGGRISVWSAALSLTVSWMSTVATLGTPAEIYTFGGQFALACIGSSLGPILAAFVYVPVLYPLQTTTSNEYITLRFNSKIMTALIGMYTTFTGMFYASIVTFAQSTTIETVSGFPVWAGSIVVVVACVIYTSLGGLRGVVWTDVFQTFLMVVGLVVMVVLGFVSVGGFTEAFEINKEWGRMELFDFDPNPTKRLNFWGLIFGNMFTAASVFGHRQEGYQRFSGMSSMKKAKLVVLLTVPGTFLFLFMPVLLGWSMFAYYAHIGCDPLKSQAIQNPNQLVPYFVMTVLNTPGLPGLFLASTSAASLSTISSVLNATAAIIWNDIIKPRVKISDATATTVSKALVVFFGGVILAVSILVSKLGGNIVQMLGTFSSALAGPMSAIFLLGMFFPWTNYKGASFGCFVGTVMALWMGFGSYSINRHLSKLPTTIANCSTSNVFFNSSEFAGPTTMMSPTIDDFTVADTASEDHEFHGIERLYAISFVWMREIATSMAIAIAVVVSFCTGPTDPKSIETRLLHPWIRSCFKTNSFEVEDEKEIKILDNRTVEITNFKDENYSEPNSLVATSLIRN